MKQYIHLADNQNLEQGNNVAKLNICCFQPNFETV